MAHIYIFCTILLTVYGQLAVKWQVDVAGSFPPTAIRKVFYLVDLLLNPWVISSFVAAFLASLTWMAALTKYDLSYAYPFMSLSFVLVLVLSNILFQELLSMPKLLGMTLIVAGIIIGSHK